MQIEESVRDELYDELAKVRASIAQFEQAVSRIVKSSLPRPKSAPVSAKLRKLKPGRAIFLLTTSDNHAASIRGSAYRIFGKGNVTTKRISETSVRVTRVR